MSRSRNGMRKRNSNFSNRKKNRTYRRKVIRGGDDESERGGDDESERESQNKYTTIRTAEKIKFEKRKGQLERQLEECKSDLETFSNKIIEMYNSAETTDDFKVINEKREIGLKDIFSKMTWITFYLGPMMGRDNFQSAFRR